MKQCQEGGSQQYRPTPRKKRDTKQLNCTPKATRGKKTIKNTNIWRLNNTLLNNQQITEEILKKSKKKSKYAWKQMKMKT